MENCGDQPCSELVSDSSAMQMEPPTVTWPVYCIMRGDTTRTKGGCAGYLLKNMYSFFP